MNRTLALLSSMFWTAFCFLVWTASKTMKKHGLFHAVGKMQLPANHFDGQATGKCFNIHVERYSTSTDLLQCDQHMIVLAGGPGQSISVWYDDLYNLARIAGPLTVIYLLEHRGVGKSECLFEDESWKIPGEVAQRMLRSGTTGDMYSTIQVAMDVVSLGTDISAQYPGTNLILMGVSYGGIVASKAVKFAPDLFDWLVLDSPSMTFGRFSHDTDKFFWKNCLDHKNCRKHGVSSEWMSYVYDQVLSGQVKNECTMKGTLNDQLQNLFRGEAICNNGRYYHPAMLAVPILLHAFHCPDPHFFDCLTSKLLQKTDFPDAWSTGKRYMLNGFINALITSCEIFKFPLGSELPIECEEQKTITDQCRIFKSYKENLYPCIAAAQYAPDVDEKSIGSNHTGIVLLVGEMDIITPPGASITWLASSSARRKVLLKYKNFGHALLPDSPCGDMLFEALRTNSIHRLKRCIELANRKSLDWNFQFEFKAASKWMSVLENHGP